MEISVGLFYYERNVLPLRQFRKKSGGREGTRGQQFFVKLPNRQSYVKF